MLKRLNEKALVFYILWLKIKYVEDILSEALKKKHFCCLKVLAVDLLVRELTSIQKRAKPIHKLTGSLS